MTGWGRAALSAGPSLKARKKLRGEEAEELKMSYCPARGKRYWLQEVQGSTALRKNPSAYCTASELGNRRATKSNDWCRVTLREETQWHKGKRKQILSAATPDRTGALRMAWRLHPLKLPEAQGMDHHGPADHPRESCSPVSPHREKHRYSQANFTELHWMYRQHLRAGSRLLERNPSRTCSGHQLRY